MQQRLPISLGREPLIDALFEVRFKQARVPLADILPGFLLGRLEPKPKITRLSAADIPAPMRANEPGLKYAATQRLDWGRYLISLGDRNIIINCKLPYPKWQTFKKTILEVLRHVREAKIDGEIERYSLKYINLIPATSNAEQVEKIEMDIRLGNIEVKDEHTSLQVHRHEEDIIHILTVVIGAQAQITGGPTKQGAVVDIDSIRNVNAANLDVLFGDLEDKLEALRQANKAKFFGCLTDAAVEEMEPKYE